MRKPCTLLFLILAASLPVCSLARQNAGAAASGQTAEPPPSAVGAPATAGQSTDANPGSARMNAVVDRICAAERQLEVTLRKFSPRVETYIQNFRPDPELGAVPTSDHYFLGRINFRHGFDVESFLPGPGVKDRIFSDITGQITRWYSVRYQPNAFAYTIMMDTRHFDRQHYEFDFVRQEFLGDVRCLVFDVQPRPHSGSGLFKGRIWVESQGYHIVRFNGTYAPSGMLSTYFHFDSWRENLQPGLWLPVYVYSEESDLHYALRRTLRFKSQTRLWGYGLTNPNHEEELTHVLIEARDPVRDRSEVVPDASPVASEREWEHEAAQNVVDRLQKAGLLAPPGDVDTVLETVVNNLAVTNHLVNLPPVHCRVLLTSTLESLSIGDNIIVSRGLIDVLPDEPSLAMILAHELAHIVLGHTLTTQTTRYAFHDRLIMPDEDVLRRLNFRPTQQEEASADAKAIQFLRNSPYKDQLGKAGLFLRALAVAAQRTPNLFGAHLGSRLVISGRVERMAELMSSSPALQPTNVDQIAALPLGSRVKVNAWNDDAELVKSKPPALLSAREKMPFEVTPLFPYLTRYNVKEELAAQATAQ
ncbi:MAG: M48 family metalloprotease [Terriglobia bacterium]